MKRMKTIWRKIFVLVLKLLKVVMYYRKISLEVMMDHNSLQRYHQKELYHQEHYPQERKLYILKIGKKLIHRKQLLEAVIVMKEELAQHQSWKVINI